MTHQKLFYPFVVVKDTLGFDDVKIFEHILLDIGSVNVEYKRGSIEFWKNFLKGLPHLKTIKHELAEKECIIVWIVPACNEIILAKYKDFYGRLKAFSEKKNVSIYMPPTIEVWANMYMYMVHSPEFPGISET